MPRYSNLLFYLIDTIGEELLADKIGKVKNNPKPSIVLNPFFDFILKTTWITSDGKIRQNNSQQIANNGYYYFKITCCLFKLLKGDLKLNDNYLNEVARRIFSNGYGPFLVTLNELIAGGYCKHLGLEIKFNSSTQEGRPDLEITHSELGSFALDAKLVPNKRFLIEHLVLKVREELVDAFSSVSKQNVWVILKSVDIDEIKKVLKKVNFNEEKNLRTSNVDIILNSNPVPNSDLQLNILESRVFIQLGGDYGSVIDEIKEHITKVIVQSKKVGYKAIPWFMVPLDANRNGIETQVIRMSGEMYPYYLKLKDDVVFIPFYSIGFEDGKLNYSIDVLQIGSNRLGIKQETFSKFMKNLITEPEFWL
ncbi:MAG: hypothetical protein ACOX6N_03470 [Patescibacteria group bacterium]|jgi:hypothetical protein